jgi:hypothetical protein
MSFKVPYAAELDTESQMLNYFLGNSYMGLLGSSLTVGTGTTLLNCTAVECTFTGYARYNLTAWSSPAIDGSGAAATTVTAYFTPTGGGGSGNIYGYFLTDSGSTYFYGVEVFTTPVSAPTGIQVAIQLTYTVISRY